MASEESPRVTEVGFALAPIPPSSSTRDEARRIAANIAKLPGAVAQDLSDSGTIRSPCLLRRNQLHRPLVA